jgi:hypothetical protein
VTPAESKVLQKGTRVCWQGNAADRGTITQTLPIRFVAKVARASPRWCGPYNVGRKIGAHS